MKIRPTGGDDRKPWHTDEYVEYLRSEAWAATRRAVLERAGHRCEHAVTWLRVTREEGDMVWGEEQSERCPETVGLEVHHRHYDTLGAEAWSDLVVLCTYHHLDADRRRQHARRKR